MLNNQRKTEAKHFVAKLFRMLNSAANTPNDFMRSVIITTVGDTLMQFLHDQSHLDTHSSLLTSDSNHTGPECKSDSSSIDSDHPANALDTTRIAWAITTQSLTPHQAFDSTFPRSNKPISRTQSAPNLSMTSTK